MTVEILIGDCRALMATMEPESIDSCVTDPPYHLTSIVKRFGKSQLEHKPTKDLTTIKAPQYKRLSRGFMGQQWDGGDVAFDPETWAAVYRVLKPGAHLVAFSGTRTYHRMVCAIEDAGFEIRDQIGWLYGSGFPKSHNQPGGWGTALKPAWEPICLARKPLIGTVAANIAAHRTGAINIDGCRVEADPGDYADGGQNNTIAFRTSPTGPQERTEQHPLGRWPANIVHDGSEEVLAHFPTVKSGSLTADQQERGGWAGTKNCYGSAERGGTGSYEANEGSAARFFYTAKAAASERGEGNNHPTVKPIELMRWLCRLVTPKGGTVLDPFAGSGSTLIAADREQFNAIGCELSEEYAAIARRRIESDRGGLLDAMEAA